MTENKVVPSFSYALKSIRRNYRRSLTLMFGIIISIAIVSGVLFYLDSASSSLVSNSLADVQIDIAIFDSTASEIEIEEIKDFVLNDSNMEIVSSAEVVVGTTPFSPNPRSMGEDTSSVGAIVASDTDFNLTMDSLREAFTGGGEFTNTYILGVEASYLDNFPFFSTTANVTEIFNNSQVLVSESLSNYYSDSDYNLNLSSIDVEMDFMSREMVFDVKSSLNITIGGEFILDAASFQDAIYAFEPSLMEDDSNLAASSLVDRIILMDYDHYWSTFGLSSDNIQINAVHARIDHTQLSVDTSIATSQISQINTRIEVYYPDVEIVDLVTLTFDMVITQLNQMRLFLIYFSLPGILLGTYICKYAIDLTIKERQKEIGLLRAKTASRKQIAANIGVESSIISIIGLILGLMIGYFSSLAIYNWSNGGGGFIEISVTSTLISISIGVVIVLITTLMSVKQLLAPTIRKSLEAGEEEKVPFWCKIYLDAILLVFVIASVIIYVLDFNPIDGFASAMFDFVAPISLWLGLTLLLVRFLELIIRKMKKPLTRINQFFYKKLGTVITNNIIHRSKHISQIIIILSLTLSFGLVVATMNATYTQGAIADTNYQVGSDIRIEFPNYQFISYNTSDMLTNLQGNLTDQIEGTTSIYSGRLSVGPNYIPAIGIDPDTFFDIAYIQDSFLQSSSISNTKDMLLDNSTGLYSNLLISYALANPSESTDEQRPGMPGGAPVEEEETQDFNIGDEIPITFGMESSNSTDITIADIVYNFPAIEDVTGRDEDEFPFVVCNVEFLENPLLDSNRSILNSGNASYALIKIDDEYDSQTVAENIETWYNLYYTNSSDIIVVDTDSAFEEYSIILTSLTGLTLMEFFLVLAVSSLGLNIFLVSSLFERRKEFGTYFAIGSPVKAVRKIITGEIAMITGFSLVVGLLLSVLLSFMYLGFISTMLILDVSMITIPYISVAVLLGLVLIATGIILFTSSRRLSKIDAANILRTV